MLIPIGEQGNVEPSYSVKRVDPPDVRNIVSQNGLLYSLIAYEVDYALPKEKSI